VILSHAEILSWRTHSRNRISCCDEFVMRGAYSLERFRIDVVVRTQFAKCGWFVHASIHVTEVIGTEFKDAQNSAALTRLLF